MMRRKIAQMERMMPVDPPCTVKRQHAAPAIRARRGRERRQHILCIVEARRVEVRNGRLPGCTRTVRRRPRQSSPSRSTPLTRAIRRFEMMLVPSIPYFRRRIVERYIRMRAGPHPRNVEIRSRRVAAGFPLGRAGRRVGGIAVERQLGRASGDVASCKVTSGDVVAFL